MKLLPFYKKYIEPFVALMILVLLVFTVVLLSNEQELKEKISENCGWDGEDYRCYCEKSEVVAIQRLINGTLDLTDVKLVR